MVLRFLQVFFTQRVGIYNHDRMAVIERKLVIEMRLGMIEVRTQRAYFQRRRIHCYNHIGFVARSIDFAT